MSARKHNIRQVARYLEYSPSYIGPGAPPVEPMGKRYRGVSRPPATEAAMDFWDANQDAARVLDPLIRELMRGDHSWKGVYFSTLLTTLYADPTTLPKWENKETTEDRTNLLAFGKMCRLIADVIKIDYGPDRQINVTIPKRNEHTSSWQTGHNRDNNEKRSKKAQDIAEAIRSRYKFLAEEQPGWTDSEVRTRLQRDFGAYATKKVHGVTALLSRETVNAALRAKPRGDGLNQN